MSLMEPGSIQSPIQAHREKVTISSSFSVEGVPVVVHSNCPETAGQIGSFLCYFAGGRGSESTPSFHLYFFKVRRDCIPDFFYPFQLGMTEVAGYFGPNPHIFSEIEFFQVYRDEAQLYFRKGIESPSLWAMLNLQTHQAFALLSEEVKVGHWGFRQLFLVLLQEIMKSRGLFPLHAGGVSRNNRGILFVAPAGFGKTSLTLSMLRRGYEFLSDDSVFIRMNSVNTPEVISFPEEVKVLEDSLAFFDELHFLRSSSIREGSDKYTFRIDTLYPGCIRTRVEPGLIAFLEKGERCVTEEISKKIALQKVFAQMSLPRANSAVLRDYFNVMQLLVKTTPCMSLVLGRNPHEAPELLERHGARCGLRFLEAGNRDPEGNAVNRVDRDNHR